MLGVAVSSAVMAAQNTVLLGAQEAQGTSHTAVVTTGAPVLLFSGALSLGQPAAVCHSPGT